MKYQSKTQCWFFPLINLFGKSQSFSLVWLYKYPKLCPKLLNLFCQQHGFQKRWILTGMENKETYGVSVANELKEMMNSARKKITILSELSQRNTNGIWYHFYTKSKRNYTFTLKMFKIIHPGKITLNWLWFLLFRLLILASNFLWSSYKMFTKYLSIRIRCQSSLVSHSTRSLKMT